jgi:hypothetical protein
MGYELNGKPISQLYYGSGAETMNSRLQRYSDALLKAHIDYDILTEKNIDELKKYKVILLPDMGRLKESEAEKLRAYVAQGGALYSSGRTSLLRTDGKLMDNFMLADVFGADYVEYADRRPTYVSATKENEAFFAPYTPDHPHMSPKAQPRIRARESAKVLGTVTYPIADARNFELYTSAISNPPYERTEYPAMMENQFGKGVCIYSAANFENDAMNDNQNLFTKIVKRLIHAVSNGPTVEFTGPECVEYALRFNEEKKRYTFSVLNYQSYDPPLPVYGINAVIHFDHPVEIKKVYTANGGKVAYKSSADSIELTLEKLDILEMIIMEI